MTAPIICTAKGKVSGKIVDLKQQDAKLVHVYRNIPFAKPPTGDLRFMPPQPVESWEGVRDGTITGNTPMYDNLFDEKTLQFIPLPEPDYSTPVPDEDCLHVSVYTPQVQKGKNLPVMVWFYGGGFVSGAERYYDGSVLAGMNDVVIVVPNYRVGLLGFFSLGPNSICSGNQGIMDQQLALKWVQDNIELFGGDKNNVTIFGESAGGISVNHHLISPLSRGLFHKAISHSGQSTMPGLFQTSTTRAHCIKIFLELLKINEKDDAKILEAVKRIPVGELLKAVKDLAMKRVTFLPTVDGKIFTKSPRQCIEDREFTKVPYIIGCNSTEGHGIIPNFGGPNFANGMTEDQFKKELFFELTEDGHKKCREFYLSSDEKDKFRFSKMLGNITGDALFVAQAVHAANVYSEEGAPVYFYHGNFRLRMFYDEKYGKDVPKTVDWCVCDHGDEILMTLGAPFYPFKMRFDEKYTKQEAKLSRSFMTYLTNFAKNSDPNKGKSVDMPWPKYGKEKTYLSLETPITTGRNLSEKAVDFWINDVYPHLVKENN